MSHLEIVERVRARIRALFQDAGVAESDVRETILIRGGHYCGRRFTAAGCQAVWFVEENQIKFSSREGQIVSVPGLGPAIDQTPRRSAA